MHASAKRFQENNRIQSKPEASMRRAGSFQIDSSL
ncbi:hypothetical protein RLEG3_20000 [Rhizobium leguminosarum bv. trifolii WSM1689]|jgi:hypothetical protein|nr:hypothetical protein RLEG3_20000 [Rhizobium leguminosarum bv. trifolii WSM1689]